MLVFYHPDSALHQPDRYFRIGRFIQHPESVQRFNILLKSAESVTDRIFVAQDHGPEPISEVHTMDYLDFLSSAWNKRSEVGGDLDEILTGHFAGRKFAQRPDGLLGLLGYHTSDTSTPIRSQTWQSVYSSAQTAISAALAALDDGVAYALSRPPGHHAYSDAAAGFCYLNNSAIAAKTMNNAIGGVTAILDIDIHHGNGTQEIFWNEPNILTVSLHCDPSNYYPYYSGYENERGSGPGEGANLNFPLPPGTGDPVFLDTIRSAITFIRSHDATSLVISLGLDTAKDDPLGVFNITTPAYKSCAAMISTLNLPTTIVQEGGYQCDALARNLTAFLNGWSS